MKRIYQYVLLKMGLHQDVKTNQEDCFTEYWITEDSNEVLPEGVTKIIIPIHGIKKRNWFNL